MEKQLKALHTAFKNFAGLSQVGPSRFSSADLGAGSQLSHTPRWGSPSSLPDAPITPRCDSKEKGKRMYGWTPKPFDSPPAAPCCSDAQRRSKRTHCKEMDTLHYFKSGLNSSVLGSGEGNPVLNFSLRRKSKA